MREPSTPSPAITAVFASVLERTQRPLRSFVRGLVDSAEQASDIVQDVFVDAWRTAQVAKAPFDGNGDELAIRRWLPADPSGATMSMCAAEPPIFS